MVIAILLFAFSAQAQKAVQLKGQILSEAKDLSRIHVINLDLEKGTTTNENGEFEIKARLNDSIFFSSIQFTNRTIVISQEMLDSGLMNVKLAEEMTELDQVVVDDINLSGHLASDVGKISVKDTERKFNLNMNLAAAIKHDRETHISGDPKGGINLTQLFGSKNNSSLSEVKVEELNTERALVNKSIQLVGHGLFTNQFELAEAEVCNFVYFCVPDSKFKRLVQEEKILALIEYFESRLPDFRVDDEKTYPEQQIPG